MMEPHRRETILVHLVWQELLRIRGLKETQENPLIGKDSREDSHRREGIQEIWDDHTGDSHMREGIQVHQM